MYLVSGLTHVHVQGVYLLFLVSILANYEMTVEWRAMILEHYRANQHLTSDAEIKSCHTVAKDYHVLLEKVWKCMQCTPFSSRVPYSCSRAYIKYPTFPQVDEMKSFRLMDTGYKPFISEEERMIQSGARVGLSLPDKGTVEGGGLEDKYMKKHEARLESVFAKTGKAVKKE
jgi:hypothetical protein